MHWYILCLCMFEEDESLTYMNLYTVPATPVGGLYWALHNNNYDQELSY